MHDEQIYDTDAKTTRTRKNIYNKLKNYMAKTYNAENITNELLKLQGLDAKHFDYISQVENFMLGQMNDTSINPNANKDENNIGRVESEAESSFRKLIGYDMLYRVCKALYGQEEAERLMNRLYSYDLYICDSTVLLNTYCYAIDSTNFIIEGRNTGSLKCSPAKHLDAYVSMLVGTMQSMSINALAGAIATGKLFVDSAYILLKDGFTVEDIMCNKDKRKYIENIYQCLIYSLNDKTRICESPFSNISVFDSVKNRKFLNDMQYLFEDTDKDIEYQLQMVLLLQDIFMDIFDKGDPLQPTSIAGIGMQFEFPVVTVNISKDKENHVLDFDFVHKFCQRQVNRYNIMVSEGSHASSCCRLKSDMDTVRLASMVNSFGGSGESSVGSHRVVTMNTVRQALLSNSYKEFISNMDVLIEDTAKILKAHKILLSNEEKAGLQPYISHGIISMDRLFSTFGLIGTYETLNILSNKMGIKNFMENNFETGFDIEFFSYINNKVLEMSKKYEIMGNIESVPGESLAVKLAKADSLLFGKSIQPEYIYSNQYIPLNLDVDVFTRLKADGRINSLVTGGGIVHITTGEQVYPAQAEKLIMYAAECGCEFFAFNTIYSMCTCGKATIGKVFKCSHCGNPINDYKTRVVGFLTSVSNWLPERRKEFKERTICDLKKVC